MDIRNFKYPINTPLIRIMITAAFEAAESLISDFEEVDKLQVSKKGAVNFVSEADLKAEKIIHNSLEKARPDFGFLMEESGEKVSDKSNLRWVIDPLDGTTNFLHAVPYFAISIALEQRNDDGSSEILAGVVYDPIHDEMFLAQKGEGAYVNNRRLRVSPRKQDFYFVTGTARMTGDFVHKTSELTRKATTIECIIRRSGAAALDLAYVAAGRYDACWFPSLRKWDMAAGIILVKEAGGITCLPSITHGGDDVYGTGAIFAGTTSAHKALFSPNRRTVAS